MFLPPPPSTETAEEPLVDLSDVLNTDADILGMLGKPSSDSGASYISQEVTVETFISSHLAAGLRSVLTPVQKLYFAFAT